MWYMTHRSGHRNENNDSEHCRCVLFGFKKILFNDYLQIDLRLTAISLTVMTMTGMLYYIYNLLLLMIIYRLLVWNENNDNNGHHHTTPTSTSTMSGQMELENGLAAGE